MNGNSLRSILLWYSVHFLIFQLRLSTVTAFETNANGSLMRCKGGKSQPPPNPPYHTIDECNRKIRLVIDLFNTKKTPEGLEFIYIKEVASPLNGVRLRLLNPIVVRLRQSQVVLAYPFNYLSAVNGKATEIVVNHENRKNYTGCDDTSSINPTCGIKHSRGQAIPFSEGFCCFCPKTPVNEKQARGGQDCSLKADPENFDEQRYKASAHCLQYNDVWYTVCNLHDPIIIHDLFLEVYNQRFLSNGSAVWVSLTHEEEFAIGNKNPSQFDANRTIVAMYYTTIPKNGTLLISSDDNRLLIPQPLPGVPIEQLPPAIKNGATDYLLISKSVIDASGELCDVAGISYQAFSEQLDRCNKPKDSCLKNQPLEFWDSDDKLRTSGKKGSYLLENYGVPSKTPIIYDKDTKEHWLALEYYEKQHTVLTIELNADNIVSLKPGKLAQISIVVTASFEKRIEFFVSVSNKGLSPATYQVQVGKCGYAVPDTAVKSVTVPPQMMEEVDIEGKPGGITLTEAFSCFVFVNSSSFGKAATREITVKPNRRCICNMHCECACYGESLKCDPMSVKDYHSAGFRGSPPVPVTKAISPTWIRDHPFLVLLAFVLLLLLIGFAKAVFGFMGYKLIAYFGLESLIFKPKQLKRYCEPELRRRKVQYNTEGYPVHPDTGQPTIVHSEEIIFLLNIFFFFVWPMKKIFDLIFKKKDKGSESSSVKSAGDADADDEDWYYDDDFSDESVQGYEVTNSDDTHIYEEVPNERTHFYGGTPYDQDHTYDETSTDEETRSYNEHEYENTDWRTQSSQDSQSRGQSPSSGEDQSLPYSQQSFHSPFSTGLNSAVSESAIEFVESRHEGEMPSVTRELARWQKGTGRITAFKPDTKVSEDEEEDF